MYGSGDDGSSKGQLVAPFVRKRERGVIDSLFVGSDRSQDRSRVDVEHLDESRLVSGDAQLAVAPDLARRARLFEPRDGLDDPVRLWRVDLQPRARRDDVPVRARR